MIDYIIIVVIFVDDRDVLNCIGWLEADQVAAEILIDLLIFLILMKFCRAYW